MAVMGQSCGGFLSITLGSDPRVGERCGLCTNENWETRAKKLD